MNGEEKPRVTERSARSGYWSLGATLCLLIGCGETEDEKAQEQRPGSSMPRASVATATQQPPNTATPAALNTATTAETELSAEPQAPTEGPAEQSSESPTPMRSTTDSIISVPGPMESDAQRPGMSRDQCREQGGRVIGDAGDGAIHRTEYRCANGEPPIATITYVRGENFAIEGEVCCAK